MWQLDQTLTIELFYLMQQEKNNPTFFEPVNNSGIGVLLHEGCYCVPYMKVHICVGIFNSFLGKVLKGLWKKISQMLFFVMQH